MSYRRRQSPGGNPVEGKKKTLTVMLQKTVATPDHNVGLAIELTPATAAGVRGGNRHIASKANWFQTGDRGKEGQCEERVGA